MKLAPGDLVAIVAPSGPVNAAALRAGVAILESWGLRVRVMPHAVDTAAYLTGANPDWAAGHLAGAEPGSAARDPAGANPGSAAENRAGADTDRAAEDAARANPGSATRNPAGTNTGSAAKDRAAANPGSAARNPAGANPGWAAGYLAGADADRAADFTAAWTDPEVRGVLCARGGYGAQRMVDLVDWAAVRAAGPKVFLGSSDITTLHAAIAVHLEQVTYFGPMPANRAFREDRETADALHRALFGHLDTLAAPEGEALVPGTAEGLLHGGTLTLLATGLGTPEGAPPAGDRVVFLEDVTEAPYRLDRYLTQLLRAGWFAGVRGVVLGSFVGCGPEPELRAMLLDRLGPLHVPILWGFPAGHGPTQLTLPFGARVRLTTNADHSAIRSALGS